MAKRESSSLAPFTTLEALLKYLISALFNFFFMICTDSFGVLDVGRSNPESQNWRIRCNWYLCFLEWAWTFSWQCQISFSFSILLCVFFYCSFFFQNLKFEFWILNFEFQYYFEGRYDLVRFIKTVQRNGLYVHLRIGPYVCAEWNLGFVIFSSDLLLSL